MIRYRTDNHARSATASAVNKLTCNVVKVAFEKSMSAKPIEAQRASIATNVPNKKSGVSK